MEPPVNSGRFSEVLVATVPQHLVHPDGLDSPQIAVCEPPGNREEDAEAAERAETVTEPHLRTLTRGSWTADT